MKRNPFLYFVIVVGIPYKIWVFFKKRFILIFSSKRKRRYLKLLSRKNDQITSPKTDKRERLLKLEKQREKIVQKCKDIKIPQRKIDLFNN